MQHDIKFVKLATDTPTRWNSTYIMINTALRLEVPLRQLIQFREELRCLALSNAQWNLVKALSEMLKVMYDGIQMVFEWFVNTVQ